MNCYDVWCMVKKTDTQPGGLVKITIQATCAEAAEQVAMSLELVKSVNQAAELSQ